MKVLIFGATGMLGSTLFRSLSNDNTLQVYGTVRSRESLQYFTDVQQKRIMADVVAENQTSLLKAYLKIQPDVVINCIGIIKQLPEAKDHLKAISINAQLPHQLSELCQLSQSRFLHISTDCVFSGKKGNYSEDDFADADDVYGRSKFLGEVSATHALTLRTSIIGHELASNRSLIGWFLAEKNEVKGFSKAIFSGLPSIELSNIIQDILLNHPKLSGLYHVAALPINKYELLQLVAQTYNKSINIIKDDSFIIDRSLNATRFNQATGYKAPPWAEFIKRMHHFHTGKHSIKETVVS